VVSSTLSSTTASTRLLRRLSLLQFRSSEAQLEGVDPNILDPRDTYARCC
jgi:ATP-dependent phosphoenolpyruvate carboxykinase